MPSDEDNSIIWINWRAKALARLGLPANTTNDVLLARLGEERSEMAARLGLPDDATYDVILRTATARSDAFDRAIEILERVKREM